MPRIPTLLAIAVCTGAAMAQFTHTIPNGTAATEGNSSNAFPWGRGSSASLQIQTIYDTTEFTAAGINFPILISRLRWRTNGGVAATGGSYSQATVEMASATVDQGSASTNFAANMGPDRTLVYSGAVTQTAVGASTPGGWFVDIPLTTNFLYDPSSGNDLVIFSDIPPAVGAAAQTLQMDVSTSGLACRVYNSTAYGSGTGTFNGSHGVVVELTYVPAAGLFPSFTASPRDVGLNTPVQFTDQSYSSDPGGVLAWQWDFDGDSIVDSSLQNPSHSYPAEGIYNVSLTVVDATHGLQTLTKNGYIRVDAVNASFTTSILSGTTVLFTDTSTGNPTSWAWDFNGDSVIDSTAQNAVFTYPAAGSYNVSLTVTDAISTDTEVVNFGIGIIPMPGFGSTYSSATSTRGVWFQTPVRFSIVSLQVPDESNHGLQNVAVYRLNGAPPAYSATASGGLELLQIGVPSSATIPCAVSFDANEFVGLIAACGDNTTMRTSYATPSGPFNSSILGQPTVLTRFLTQTNLVSTMGTAPYSSEAAGPIGRVHIGVSPCVGLAYGAGSPSGAGPQAPKLTTTALPFVGQNAQLTIDNGDSNALGLLALGIGRVNVPTPVGTILVGNIGATFLVNGGVPMNAGQFTFSVPVPNNPALNGVGPFTWQNINLLLANNLVSMSNGQEWWLAL